MAAETAQPPSALMTTRAARSAQATAPGPSYGVLVPAQSEYTAVGMASTSRGSSQLHATTIRRREAWSTRCARRGLVRKGAHRSGSVTAVPAQQLPDDG